MYTVQKKNPCSQLVQNTRGLQRRGGGGEGAGGCSQQKYDISQTKVLSDI